MQNRIRVGVLLFKDNKILLVKHVDPKNGFTFFVSPGGQIENDESLFDAAIRETFEETGLTIKTGKVVYLRQHISDEFNWNCLGVYVLGEIQSGELTIENMCGKGGDDQFIKGVAFFSQEEVQDLHLFPKMLYDTVWKDKEDGFSHIAFIGVDKD